MKFFTKFFVTILLVFSFNAIAAENIGGTYIPGKPDTFKNKAIFYFKKWTYWDVFYVPQFLDDLLTSFEDEFPVDKKPSTHSGSEPIDTNDENNTQQDSDNTLLDNESIKIPEINKLDNTKNNIINNTPTLSSDEEIDNKLEIPTLPVKEEENVINDSSKLEEDEPFMPISPSLSKNEDELKNIHHESNDLEVPSLPEEIDKELTVPSLQDDNVVQPITPQITKTDTDDNIHESIRRSDNIPPLVVNDDLPLTIPSLPEETEDTDNEHTNESSIKTNETSSTPNQDLVEDITEHENKTSDEASDITSDQTKKLDNKPIEEKLALDSKNVNDSEVSNEAKAPAESTSQLILTAPQIQNVPSTPTVRDVKTQPAIYKDDKHKSKAKFSDLELADKDILLSQGYSKEQAETKIKDRKTKSVEELNAEDQKELKKRQFVENELTMFILPDDDVILGKITPSAELTFADNYKFVKMFWDAFNEYKASIKNKQANQYLASIKEPKHEFNKEDAEEITDYALKTSSIDDARVVVNHYKLTELQKVSGDFDMLAKAVTKNDYDLIYFYLMRGLNIDQYQVSEYGLISGDYLYYAQEDVIDLLKKAGATEYSSK